jgi:cyclopropane fatty-acyl-phospholipid synthase-like methyltransferase
MDSVYYNLDIQENLNVDICKEAIGGLFEEIGKLQLDFCIRQGLTQKDKILDIGCGCFRGGINFIKYLGQSNYYGQDISHKFIEVGKKILTNNNIEYCDKNFIINDNFDFNKFSSIKFTQIIAISVFTHLRLNSLKICLYNIYNILEDNGKFFASFFEITDNKYIINSYRHPTGITTYYNQDPYHYFLSDLKNMIPKGLRYRLEYIGNWDHPRNQMMVCFHKY